MADINGQQTKFENAARAAYEAYCFAVGWVGFNGDQLPAWEMVHPKIKAGWNAAARQVAGMVAADIVGNPEPDPRIWSGFEP